MKGTALSKHASEFLCYKPLFHFQMHFTLVVVFVKSLLHVRSGMCEWLMLEQSQSMFDFCTRIKLFIFWRKFYCFCWEKRQIADMRASSIASCHCTVMLLLNGTDKNWMLDEPAFKNMTKKNKWAWMFYMFDPVNLFHQSPCCSQPIILRRFAKFNLI